MAGQECDLEVSAELPIIYLALLKSIFQHIYKQIIFPGGPFIPLSTWAMLHQVI